MLVISKLKTGDEGPKLTLLNYQQSKEPELTGILTSGPSGSTRDTAPPPEHTTCAQMRFEGLDDDRTTPFPGRTV